MKIKLILAHDADEEGLAEALEQALGEAGFAVVHRGTILVGGSYTGEFSKYLSQRFPVVLCGTIRAIGTGWVRRIVNAAQDSGIDILPVKLEGEADLQSIIPSDIKIIDCSGAKFVKGVEQLIRSLQALYPDEDEPQAHKEEVIKPSSHLDKLTPETNFNERVISAYREKLRDEIRARYPSHLPHKVFLDKIGFRIEGKLTLTGVLLFTEHATRYSPMAITKCSMYEGTEPLRRHGGTRRDIDGPVQKQIDEAYDFILLNIDKKERRKPGRAELEVLYRYPVDCIREMVANAICHRDYTVGDQPVQIRLFSDRLEISSPGAWYGQKLDDRREYFLKDLKSGSKLRNPTLAQAIYNIRLFEGRGEGLPTSVDDCQQIGAPMPIVTERDGSVVVTIFPVEGWAKESNPAKDEEGDEPPTPELKVSLSRLPITGTQLFGRDGELKLLDETWAKGSTNILSVVAWGGVGKSALVNHWLARMARDDYRGAERVYGWSFYSQGTTDRAVSADQFVEAALAFFGDTDPNLGSPWDKGERLARLVGRRRTLLVLDGLEPLQFPPGPDEGRLKEQSMQALLRGLAAYNEGLCVISTRVRVTDLADYEASTAARVELENLSPEAGAQVLAAQGAKGTRGELEQASREFDGHSLALTLLGSYLSDVYGGDIGRRTEVRGLEDDERHGRHAQRVMTAYERWFGEGPELSVLRMLGLFNRPADRGSIDALRAAPAIPGLTDALQRLSESAWQRTLSKLRRAHLLAERADPHPDTLDAHPLVREHFGRQLRRTNPDAWREGNSRLYEHLTNTTKEFPDTIEEMSPLYAAITHGCAAGRYQEALDDVFLRRINRGEAFSVRMFGAFGANLAALAEFFDSPWKQPVSVINESDQAFILNSAGFALRALGQSIEATQPLQAGLEARTRQEDWINAATVAGNLSELYLTIGDLSQALTYARKSIELSDRSGDSIQRMHGRATLADVLYQTGGLSESEAHLLEAEEIQKDRQPDFPLLSSLAGFRYCTLLLHLGRYSEVKIRAARTIEWAKEHMGLLAVALDYLSLGRAYLLQTRREAMGNFFPAADYLDHAVDGLRQAGTLHRLPLGLFARAELYRMKGDFDQARVDLDEAMSIAIRGTMGLHRADCHLEYARLYLAEGPRDLGKAREHLATAKEMIERMGYHLRDEAVRELEAELEEA